MATFFNLDQIEIGKALKEAIIIDLMNNGSYMRMPSSPKQLIGDFVHDGKGSVLEASNIPYLTDYNVLYLREHYEGEIEITYNGHLRKWYITSISKRRN